ncbi:cytochrome c-type biogenesis protein CcmH [Undibacterium sp. CY18W]|uniref:Cytochrome c-type biogenesis protein n=1 Tax=Undibacterium hunanense TaxID=2762292 RepID=A0ABR6ZM73_9BURK|nr:cytochrome c-type biogenesis protein [Undibacterium hunanense]MBC3916984.1 cytochrome c-type biogenesis protein CcmH [Undibacterium hunanense]
MAMILLVSAAFYLLWPSLAAAAPREESASGIEQRVQKLAQELHCLVCRNQTLADSHTEMAVNLKQQIREKIQQGQDEQQITDFLLTRYGDVVRYRPTLNVQTLLLWSGPYLLLLTGLIWLFARFRSASSLDDGQEPASIEVQHYSDPLL